MGSMTALEQQVSSSSPFNYRNISIGEMLIIVKLDVFCLQTQIKHRNVKIKLNQTVCTRSELTCEVVLRKLSVYVFIEHTLSQMAVYHSAEKWYWCRTY
jgi:hypothetical protein